MAVDIYQDMLQNLKERKEKCRLHRTMLKISSGESLANCQK
jgi:hypothetical protein